MRRLTCLLRLDSGMLGHCDRTIGKIFSAGRSHFFGEFGEFHRSASISRSPAITAAIVSGARSVRIIHSCTPFSVCVTALTPAGISRWTRNDPVASPRPRDFPPYERPITTARTPSNASIRRRRRAHSLEVVWWRPREDIPIDTPAAGSRPPESPEGESKTHPTPIADPRGAGTNFPARSSLMRWI